MSFIDDLAAAWQRNQSLVCVGLDPDVTRLRAIVALTESGLTAQLMSRSRSDIPIYAFTRHEATRRRVTLYRGVHAVPFDISNDDPNKLYPAIFDRLLELGLVETGDQVLLTKGELSGVSGGTNSMQILRVTKRT